MRHQSDDRNLVIVDDGAVHGLARWAPMVVVVCVFAGFVGLSWYAYHAGVQSVKDDDLLVVEADKTPLKEKPLDPGGMKFPNQDKTIFDTFAGNSQQPAKVERVLPKPEEQMAKPAETPDTTTWINEKLQKHEQEAPAAAKEKVIGSEAKPVEAAIPAQQPDKPIETPPAKFNPPKSDAHEAAHQVIKAEPVVDEEAPQTYVAKKTAVVADNAAVKPAEPAPQKVVALPEKPVTAAKEEKKEQKKEQVEKPADKPKEEKKAAVPSGHFAVQLGAYRSEDEANEAWEKMHLKQKELSDKSPTIIEADLGEKGIYYRLRVSGLASVGDAKALCAALSAKGQACILPVGK